MMPRRFSSVSTHVAFALVVAFSLYVGCRSWSTTSETAERCTANEECADGQTCSISGVCEASAERRANAVDTYDHVGRDEGSFSLWLRYGTHGALYAGDDGDGDGTAPRREAAALTDLSALCTTEDVRTDDLSFSHTEWYPEGYWGGTPIADAYRGRCGGDLETMTWRLLNCERITRGLAPVDCDLRLVWIGRQHASDMASRNYFGHTTPEGLDAFRRLQGRGIRYDLAGENLALQPSILDAHRAWMGSPLHRRNMLAQAYNYAGIGVVRSGNQLILSEAFLGGAERPDDTATPPPALDDTP